MPCASSIGHCASHHCLHPVAIDRLPCQAPAVFLAVDLTLQMSIVGLESVDSNTVIANAEDSQETVYQTNHVGSSFSYTFGPADGLIPGQAYTVRTLLCLTRHLQLAGAV